VALPLSQKGKVIAKNNEIRFDGKVWIVPSQNGKGEYQVNLQNQTCTCPDFLKHLAKCKHQYAVDEKINDIYKTIAGNNNEKKKPKKKQTWRNWSGYNTAQVKNRSKFLELLFELCKQIDKSVVPKQSGRGRKRSSITDIVFGMLLKVYEVKNSRAMPEILNEVLDKKYLSETFCYNTISNYFQKDWVTSILSELVTVSSLPLAAVETSFSVDSSGFGVSNKTTWQNVKYGNNEEWHQWVKAHIICGNKTKIIISAEITAAYKADSPFLAALVNKTAKHFVLQEVMGDAAYSSSDNLELIEKSNAKALIAFKSNAVFGKNGETWDRLLNYYKFRYDEFHARYRFRSNVETAFSSIKSVFGQNLRSRSETGQINELLAKIICHNLRVLVRSIYELDIHIDLANFKNYHLPAKSRISPLPTSSYSNQLSI
jgi:transposase